MYSLGEDVAVDSMTLLFSYLEIWIKHKSVLNDIMAIKTYKEWVKDCSAYYYLKKLTATLVSKSKRKIERE